MEFHAPPPLIKKKSHVKTNDVATQSFKHAMKWMVWMHERMQLSTWAHAQMHGRNECRVSECMQWRKWTNDMIEINVNEYHFKSIAWMTGVNAWSDWMGDGWWRLALACCAGCSFPRRCGITAIDVSTEYDGLGFSMTIHRDLRWLFPRAVGNLGVLTHKNRPCRKRCCIQLLS